MFELNFLNTEILYITDLECPINSQFKKAITVSPNN